MSNRGIIESKSKPTILHVTTVHAPFDPRIYYKEAKTLAAAGWNVLLATTTSEHKDVDGVKFLPLGVAGRSRLGRIPRNWRALKLMLGRNDIIHIHDPELLLAAAIARMFGRRIVYDVHEFYHSRFEQDYWAPRFLRPLIALYYTLTEHLILPRLSGVVVVSDAMVEHYSTFVGKDRVVTVHNFPLIRAEELRRLRALPRPLQGPYIIHTGAASKNRMFHVTVRAAQLLREMGNTLPIINLGPIDLSGYDAKEQIALIRQAKDADVRLLGRVPYEDSIRWLAHAHVGYMPLAKHPRNINTLPVKLFEYFAFGLPVVAAGFGAIERTVNEFSAGLLVPYDDPAAHARALHAVSTDLAAHSKFADASARAAVRFSFEMEFPKLETLYRNILSNGHSQELTVESS